MNAKTRTLIWLLVALAALGFFILRIPRDTFYQAVRHINVSWAFAAVGLQLIAQTILATRWVILLRVQGVPLAIPQAIKLTYLGLFYNNLMPGAVGGDLLKGWYVTHHSPPHLRLQAAVSVFVDRIIGLIGIVFVGAVASLFIGPELAVRGIQIRWLGWALLAGMCLAAAVFFSRHIRRSLFLSRLLQKLPFASQLRSIDNAIRIYRSHLPSVAFALLLTVILQGSSIVAVWFLTKALLLDVSLLQCIIVMPIIWVVSSAIPVPGGLGIAENMILLLYSVVIDPQNPTAAHGPASALALLFRLMTITSSLPGALIPLFGGHLPSASQLSHLQNLPDDDPDNPDAAPAS